MKFATDKVQHGYLPAYLRIAAELGPAARVCEIGVQHGHGLDMFQALFPDGLVAGVDANRRQPVAGRHHHGSSPPRTTRQLSGAARATQRRSGTCSPTTPPTTGT